MTEKTSKIPYYELCRPRYILVMLLFALLSYFFVDSQVAIFFSTHQEKLVPLCHFVEVFFKGPYFLSVLGLLFLATFYVDKLKKYNSLLMVILYFLILGQVFLVFSKVIVGRARPELFLKHGVYGFFLFQTERNFLSFPSGHTLNIMILTSILMLAFPKKKYWILGFGLLLSFTRAIYTKHYLSDWYVSTYLSFVLVAMGTMLLQSLNKYSSIQFLFDKLTSVTLNQRGLE